MIDFFGSMLLVLFALVVVWAMFSAFVVVIFTVLEVEKEIIRKVITFGMYSKLK